MNNKIDKNKYIKDEEYIKILEHIKIYGVYLEEQTTRPYINTIKTFIPSNFSINNIENLINIKDELGYFEFSVFTKKDNYIELRDYSYIGYDYDKSKTPKLIMRKYEYYDYKNEFTNLISKESDLEYFFRSRKHIEYIKKLNLRLTHIVLIKVDETITKYTIINDTEKGYLDKLIKNRIDRNYNIYTTKTRTKDCSLMEESDLILIEKNKYKQVKQYSI